MLNDGVVVILHFDLVHRRYRKSIWSTTPEEYGIAWTTEFQTCFHLQSSSSAVVMNKVAIVSRNGGYDDWKREGCLQQAQQG